MKTQVDPSETTKKSDLPHVLCDSNLALPLSNIDAHEHKNKQLCIVFRQLFNPLFDSLSHQSSWVESILCSYNM